MSHIELCWSSNNFDNHQHSEASFECPDLRVKLCVDLLVDPRISWKSEEPYKVEETITYRTKSCRNEITCMSSLLKSACLYQKLPKLHSIDLVN